MAKNPKGGRRSPPDVSIGQELYKTACQRIPGGTQLFGKRAELFLPEGWPTYFRVAKGCRIWDLDGNTYRDFTMCATGTAVLGYADPEVEIAVISALQSGNISTLNCPEEIELADLLCELHPWADQVRYARTGGEIMAIASRLARAATGRDLIAFCGYHGWHDWYLAANLETDDRLKDQHLPGLEPLGVPKSLSGSVATFRYNDLDALEDIVSRSKEQLAAICLEPYRNDGPDIGFLEGVKEISQRIGAVLIFDEITSAWRVETSGLHVQLGVNPDLVTFAKTISNGIPMAALIGRKDVMEYTKESFISSAYWTDKLGPAAALATLKKHRELNVGSALAVTGDSIQKGWQSAAENTGLKIQIGGIPQMTNFLFDRDVLVSQTLFTQEMLARGFLANNVFFPTYAHKSDDVDEYLEAVEESFEVIAVAQATGEPKKFLRGPVRSPNFARLD